MRAPAPKSGLVLIVERDESLRKMMAIVLRRAGFATRMVRDVEAASTLLVPMKFDVIVRELTLPAQPCAMTTPHLLSRTVFTATAQERLLNETDAANAFAVILKPFEIEELMRVIIDCARQTAVDISTLHRFVTSLPTLRSVLTAPTPSPRELMLRGEMRRTILKLSVAFHAVAQTRLSRTQAAAFLHASAAAAELASDLFPRSARDH